MAKDGYQISQTFREKKNIIWRLIRLNMKILDE